jgi:hypothetical protein
MPDIIINGPEGRIEGKYTHSKTPNAPLALILHPHPEHGGTMNNRVTYSLFQTFAARGFSTLRFNFRGVGNSQGEYSDGEGELADAAAALDWMQELNQNAPYVWVAGFSFGSWIGMQLLMRRPEIRGWVSVAPPATTEDFSFLAPCPTSGLIVHGEQDTIVAHTDVQELVDRLRAQKGIDVDYELIQGCNHFFRGHMGTLVEKVNDYLNKAHAGRHIDVKALLSKAA